MPGCWVSMARRDGLPIDLEPSRLLEASFAVTQRQTQASEIDHVNETAIGKTDEERIGGISRPVVAPPPDVTGPFCLFRLIAQGNTEGASATTNSAGRSDLQQLLQSFSAGAVSQGKKIKSSLSSFLPTIPGDVDNPGLGDTSLRTLVHNPPIGGKELVNLPAHLLLGFKLRPGQIPEQFRTAFHEKPKKKKRKKPKLLALEQRQGMQQSVPADVRRDGATNPGLLGFTGATKTVPSESSVLPAAQNGADIAPQVTKKPKKRKHEDGDRDKDRKKKKREKKKKKERHRSPQPGGAGQTFHDGVRQL